MRGSFEITADKALKFFTDARETSAMSSDRSTRVGCIITNRFDDIVGGGVNDFPHGVDCEPDCRHERPAKYQWIEHAERNAIYEAARRGNSLLDTRMYLPWFPCVDCARAIIQSGIRTLVCIEPDFSDERWGDDFRVSVDLLAEGGVLVIYFDEKTLSLKSGRTPQVSKEDTFTRQMRNQKRNRQVA